MPARRSALTTFGKSAGSTARMSRLTERAPVRVELAFDRVCDRVSRRELVDEAVAVAVQQGRALTADRLGDEEAVVAVRGVHGGRVELHQLEVGEACAGEMGDQHP